MALMAVLMAVQAGEQWKTTNYRSEGFTMGTNFGLPQIAGLQLGWQFGPHWNAGVELSAQPLFSSIDLRYYIRDRRNTPFAEAKASVFPTLQVGYAWGKLELALGAMYVHSWSDDATYGYEIGRVWPSFTVGYTYTFGKW